MEMLIFLIHVGRFSIKTDISIVHILVADTLNRWVVSSIEKKKLNILILVI